MTTLTRRSLLAALGLGALAVPLQGCSGVPDPSADAKGEPTSVAAALIDRRPGVLTPAVSAHLGVLAGRLASLTATPTENFALSPFSIASALSMARNGAHGGTASGMDTVLGITDLDAHNRAMNALDQYLMSLHGPLEYGGGEITLRQANRVWLQQGLTVEQPFLDALALDYGAGVRLDDFTQSPEAARGRINGWVAEQTAGRIPTLFPQDSLTELTRLVLVNALYFKAAWMEELNEVGRRPFTLGSGTPEAVPMLAVGTHGWYEDATCQATALQYQGGMLSMTLIKPKATVKATFDAWTKGGLDTLLASMDESQLVRLTFPEWKQRSTLTLRRPLTALGMGDAFTGRADFSGVTTAEPLTISEVHHQVFVAVDKYGTEAAAATGIGVVGGSAPQEPRTLTLDRPFCWVIHDRDTRTPLFVGSVADPTAGA
ncbi:MAG TPA: serpin family protein [Propionibacteriaceae bacterium]|nr:serpin family protein [Propionibacteriaceae bacterium]